MIDNVPLNNRVDNESNPDFGRGGFLLHPGTISHGCVTIFTPRSVKDGGNPDLQNFGNERYQEYNVVKNIMNATTKKEVTTYDGRWSTLKNLFGYHGTKRMDYGTFEVIQSTGTEKIQDITNDKSE